MKNYFSLKDILSNKFNFLIIILFCVFIINFIYLRNTAPFPFEGFTPELIFEYTAGKNYFNYGFLKYLLSTDYSASPDLLDHPYIYTHQYDLPAIIIGILLNLSIPLLAIRAFFTLLSLVGVLYLYKVLKFIIKSDNLALFISFIFIIFYNESFVFLEHSTHAFYYICYFGGFYYLLKYFNNETKIDLYFYFLLVTISIISNIIVAAPLIIATSIYCFFGRREKFKKILIGNLSIILFLIALMILRNAYILGWYFAINDFWLTLSNRIFSSPTRSELSKFYQDYNVVLWGVQTFQPEFFASWLIAPFKKLLSTLGIYPFIPFFYLLLKSKDFRRLNSSSLLSAAVIFFGTYSWNLLFFSYGTNYLFSLIEKMMYVYAIIVLFLTYKYLWSNWFFECKSLFKSEINAVLYTGVAFGIILMGTWYHFYAFVQTDFPIFINKYKSVLHAKRYAPIEFDLLSDGKFPVIATNIDGTTASFFLRNSIIKGGCNLKGLTTNSSEFCTSNFNIKNSGAPHQYILYSLKMHAGFYDCNWQCRLDELAFLKKNYKSLPMGIDGFYLFSR